MKNHLSVTSTMAPMANHPRRSWRKQWTVDLAARQARHEPTGAVVQFGDHDPSGLVDRSPDPAGDQLSTIVNRLELAQKLTQAHGQAAAAQMLRRLQADALDVYQRAQARR